MVDHIDLNFGKKIILALAHSEKDLCRQCYLFVNRSTAAEVRVRTVATVTAKSVEVL